METPLFPSYDHARFPLKHIGMHVRGAANYRDSQDELLYYEILRSKQVPNFGRISTKFLVMCRSGMALWRPNLRADWSPMASVIYRWIGSRRKGVCLYLQRSRSCARHTLHVCISTCPSSGRTLTLGGRSDGRSSNHPGTWPVSCPPVPTDPGPAHWLGLRTPGRRRSLPTAPEQGQALRMQL